MAPIPRIIPADQKAVIIAAEHLRAGQLVAIPTETVYGLAADALNNVAVQHIYTTKGRPSNNPLICHVSDTIMVRRFVTVSRLAEKLMESFWPGPLTLVLPHLQSSGIAASVSAGLDTLAVRCPANSITRAIIQALDHPVAAPSANPSGKLSPTTARDVADGLGGKIPLILDGGPTPIGIESTIVSVLDDRITLLRPGTITSDDISAATGQPVYDRDNDLITAPGQLASHYAPNAAVRLNAEAPAKGEAYIGFGQHIGALNLSAAGDLTEAARTLFATLRQADQLGAAIIAVAPIPHKGIGIAINDRLKRAAAPRT